MHPVQDTLPTCPTQKANLPYSPVNFSRSLGITTGGTKRASFSSLASGVICLSSVLEMWAVLLVSHQEDGLDLRVELAVGHQHRELRGDVGQRADATDHHAGIHLPYKVHRQAAKHLHLDIGDMPRALAD